MESISNEKYENLSIGAYTYKVNDTHLHLLKDFNELIPHYECDQKVFLKVGEDKLYLPCSVTNRLLIAHWQELSDNQLNETFVSVKKLLVDHLLRQTYAKGYETPSCVQSLGILQLCAGRDVLIQSKSGTGKTHTFLSGTIWHFDPEDKELQHLYITTSHEVASQIYEGAIHLFPVGTKISLCIGQKRDTSAQGGFKPLGNLNNTPKHKTLGEEREEVRNAQVIIGTMGKIYDYLCNKKWANTQYLKTVTVDEFDNIVTSNKHRSNGIMTTEDQITEIMKIVPERCQKIFFSATVSNTALQVARNYFRKEENAFIALLDTEDYTLEGIKQYYVECTSYNEKGEVLLDLLKQCHISQCIIFCNTIQTTIQLKHFLDNQKIQIPASLFHAGLSTVDRKAAMQDFRQHKTRLLISTDLTARGIDVPAINLVVNYDMPNNLNTYIHRVGRSGRYGKKGVSINLIATDNGEMIKVDQVNECSVANKMVPLPRDLEALL